MQVPVFCGLKVRCGLLGDLAGTFCPRCLVLARDKTCWAGACVCVDVGGGYAGVAVGGGTGIGGQTSRQGFGE
jgi:hypothetical protein